MFFFSSRFYVSITHTLTELHPILLDINSYRIYAPLSQSQMHTHTKRQGGI